MYMSDGETFLQYDCSTTMYAISQSFSEFTPDALSSLLGCDTQAVVGTAERGREAPLSGTSCERKGGVSDKRNVVFTAS